MTVSLGSSCSTMKPIPQHKPKTRYKFVVVPKMIVENLKCVRGTDFETSTPKSKRPSSGENRLGNSRSRKRNSVSKSEGKPARSRTRVVIESNSVANDFVNVANDSKPMKISDKKLQLPHFIPLFDCENVLLPIQFCVDPGVDFDWATYEGMLILVNSTLWLCL